ncbi:glycerate kinase [Aestuariimicrobium ganziense]|uniref:glycerate kinase n=1 Tax=Aestuariimicrobium ganziense TaxID=2773677 RepID=UPI001944F91E|nr:glycerate kinase [Aestuariimicrobium ganziense]
MRVVVVTDRHPGIRSSAAGAAIGRAWAERGAQVAVVPIGQAGAGLGEALADLWGADEDLVQVADRAVTIARGEGESGIRLCVSLHAPLEASPPPHWHGSSSVVGQALAAALADLDDDQPLTSIVLEVAEPTWQDGGLGMLRHLGLVTGFEAGGLAGQTLDLDPVRGRLRGADLVLAIPADELTIPLVGLRGITSRAAHAHGHTDPATMLRLDQDLVDLAAAAGAGDLAQAPGSGAVGGVGWAVLALGGRVVSGPGLCRELSGLDRTAAHADLVVTGGDRLDFGSMGGDVLTEVREVAEQVLRPLVVIAGQNFISSRELRSIGVEAAYPVHAHGAAADATQPAVSEDDLLVLARRVAASWSW